MDAMEIFTLVTGIIYLILEIGHKNLMWVVGILTAGAAVVVFFSKGLYASMGLNVYYVLISIWGLYSWHADKVKDMDKDKDKIQLRRLSRMTIVISTAVMFCGTVLAYYVLQKLDDPSPLLDAAVTILSAIATYWLSRSYVEEWLLWIIADCATMILCLMQGMYWMSVLYLLYCVSAVYGYFYWLRHGSYLNPTN